MPNEKPPAVVTVTHRRGGKFVQSSFGGEQADLRLWGDGSILVYADGAPGMSVEAVFAPGTWTEARRIAPKIPVNPVPTPEPPKPNEPAIAAPPLKNPAKPRARSPAPKPDRRR